jgi:nitronate monooxygenase
MSRSTSFTQRLGLSAPIVQGPFGSGLSAVDLVVAVSESGGLGSFGVHHLHRDGIHDVASAIRARTSRPFALNLWIPFDDSENPSLSDAEFERGVAALRPYFEQLEVPTPTRPARFTPAYQEQIEAVLEARPSVFSFVFGIPEPSILERCRELGIVTVGTVTTVDEAMAMDRAGVNAIVASGFEAGGHRISFLRPAEDSLVGTMALIPQVVDAVNIPVIAAGGIADGRGIAATLCLGAQAAQIGTAFLACEESAASWVHREQLHSPHARYTALTRAFTGRLARGISNRFIDEMRAHEAQTPNYPVQAWLTAQYKQPAIAQQRTDLLSLWSGQSAALIKHRNARELMAALIAETDEILASDSVLT